MKKIIAGGIAALAFALPGAAFAAEEAQLISLYQQLIGLLQQQVLLLQNTALLVSPETGTAPLSVTFTIPRGQGNEAIDFGDGRSTGSAGCPTNSKGFCDLSKPVTHVYQFPGNYTVTLYRTTGTEAKVVATYKVTVSK